MNLNLSDNPLAKEGAKLSNVIDGEFNSHKQEEKALQKAVGKDMKLKATLAPPQGIKNLKTKDLTAEQLDQEISTYFGEEDEEESDLDLGSAYRAEIRQESRKLRKKLIQQ